MKYLIAILISVTLIGCVTPIGYSESKDIKTENLEIINKSLPNSIFDDVNLSKSKFNNVNLKESTFFDINMSSVNFKNMNLSDAQISECNYTGMKIEGILVTDLIQFYKENRK